MKNDLYLSEFGPAYEVPDAIVDTLEDLSWHNDVCPSFGVEDNDGNGVRLWVEHPDVDQRESAFGSRYVVTETHECETQEPAYAGDDLAAALSAYHALAGE
jgi:hypothetical protein